MKVSIHLPAAKGPVANREKRLGVFFLITVALAAGVVTIPASSTAQIAIGVGVLLALPPLPVYAQSPLPGPDYR